MLTPRWRQDDPDIEWLFGSKISGRCPKPTCCSAENWINRTFLKRVMRAMIGVGAGRRFEAEHEYEETLWNHEQDMT